MDADSNSTNTSIDDKTDDFGENPTRDILAEGLMSILKPAFDQLDERLKDTRTSQTELKIQLDKLSEELLEIKPDEACPVDLEIYVNKLVNAKHKITVVTNILQAAQDRLNKVQAQAIKEREKRKTLMEQPPSEIN